MENGVHRLLLFQRLCRINSVVRDVHAIECSKHLNVIYGIRQKRQWLLNRFHFLSVSNNLPMIVHSIHFTRV